MEKSNSRLAVMAHSYANKLKMFHEDSRQNKAAVHLTDYELLEQTIKHLEQLSKNLLNPQK